MLKDYCSTWAETKRRRTKEAVTMERKAMLAIARLERLHSEVMKTFPKEISATIFMMDNGYDYITAIIDLPNDAPAKDTVMARSYLSKRYHKADRDFDVSDGTFTWSGIAERKDREGWYQEKVKIANTDPGKCKITKYEETVTRFKTDCK